MPPFSTRHPQAYGLIVTFLGVAFFFPDALVVRLIEADTMTIAVWRGLAGAITTRAFVAQFNRSAWTGFAALLTPAALAMIALQGTGSIFFLASLQHTSVANSLLILATAPFLAAIFSRLFLHETIDRATALAIVTVFAGVMIIASGSMGGGTLLGDLFSFLNAMTIAGYYVVLRKARTENLIIPIACGYLFTSLIAPAVATRAFSSSRRILIACLVGAAGYAAGLGFSFYADLPAGATVVCCLCLLTLAGLGVFRPAGYTGRP